MLKKGCGCLGTIIAFVVILVIILLIIPTGKKEENKNLTDIELLVEKCSISQEEAELIKKDLDAVGITDLTEITEFDGAPVENIKSFKYNSTTVSGNLILKDNKTNHINTGDITLFDSFKGGVIDNISHYYLTADEQTLYLYQSEECIKQCLKSPSSAKFPNWYSGSWKIGRYDDVITVSSYVDAQNSFGATIRSEFLLQFSYSTKQCTYCQMDGETVFGALLETHKSDSQ